MTREEKADAILAEAAAIAGGISWIPNPGSLAELAFSEIEPLVGPQLVHAFGWLFHKIKHSPDPKLTAAAVIVAAHPVADEYRDPDAIYGG